MIKESNFFIFPNKKHLKNTAKLLVYDVWTKFTLSFFPVYNKKRKKDL